MRRELLDIGVLLLCWVFLNLTLPVAVNLNLFAAAFLVFGLFFATVLPPWACAML